MLSWRLAPLSEMPSGVPRASVTTWRLVPGLPRSVGFGPTSAPPFLPPGLRCRVPPGSSPALLRRAGAPAAPGAAGSKPRPHATRPACASRSCRSSPVRRAPHATECRYAARTGYQPRPNGPALAADHPSAWDAPAAEEARWQARGRQGQEAPSLLNASKPVLSLALRSGRQTEGGMARKHHKPQDLGLGQRVERLARQQLVAELAVEALHGAVFPRTARLDIRRLGTERGDPRLDRRRDELRPVARVADRITVRLHAARCRHRTAYVEPETTS